MLYEDLVRELVTELYKLDVDELLNYSQVSRHGFA